MRSVSKLTAETLKQLGITRKYKGYHSILLSIELLSENESRLTAVTKEIYMEIGRQEGHDWKAVERNIRTVLNQTWHSHLDAFREVISSSGEPPCVSDFLSDLFDYIQEKAETNE